MRYPRKEKLLSGITCPEKIIEFAQKVGYKGRVTFCASLFYEGNIGVVTAADEVVKNAQGSRRKE